MPRSSPVSILDIDLGRGEATLALVVDLPDTPTSTGDKLAGDGETRHDLVSQFRLTDGRDNNGEGRFEYRLPYVAPKALGLKVPSNGLRPLFSKLTS
jgi:hypothetical protein